LAKILILILICGIGVVLSFAACSDEATQESVKEEKIEPPPMTEPVTVVEPEVEPEPEVIVEETPEEHGYLMSGENGYLSTEVIMGTGEDVANLQEVVRYASANNQTELEAMISEGRALIVAKGTPITLIEQNIFSGKVKVTETGEIGWVPAEFLSKTKPE
jgi:hypothetical protein